jgi:hypothetical protein
LLSSNTLCSSGWPQTPDPSDLVSSAGIIEMSYHTWLDALSFAQKLWLGLKSDESRCPCIISLLRGKASNFSSLIMLLAMALSYMPFIVLSYIPSVSNFLRVLL